MNAAPRRVSNPTRKVLGAVALSCMIVGAFFAGEAATATAADDLAQLEQQAVQAAVAHVAPSVVKIETVGGLERIGRLLVNTGPTTGLVVSSDGYIISSAFNFIARPSSILVGLPDGTRTPAKLVATDHQRMLVLLKVSVDEKLSVPVAVPENEIKVGQWAVAIGRTFDAREPNMSVGIVSGLNRIWGKAIQTDAKISPANYGGPLIDIQGRVLGVLVPLSPDSSEEIAGVEWYDSGIGFAVTLEHINKMLPKLIEGHDLKPGVMGVTLDGRDMYTKQPVITGCRPNSPAYKAGFKAGDRIVEIDGRPVERLAHMRTALSRHYAGDTLQVVVLRGEERIARDVPLVDTLDPYSRAFLGILPERPLTEAKADKKADANSDEAAADKQPADEKTAKPAGEVGGVTVRYVYPESPAAKGGVKPGDVITAIDELPVANRDALIEHLSGVEIGQQVKLTLQRGGEARSVELTAEGEPAQVAQQIPSERPAANVAAEDRPPVGKFAVKLPEFKNECTAYVPDNYDPRIAYGLVVWLHPPGGTKDDELLGQWRKACDSLNLILLAPRAADPAKWAPTEARFIGKAIEQIRAEYNIDPYRVAVCGQQSGGSMAYLVAFAGREVIRGVAAIDAPVLGRVPENDPAYRLTFWATTAKKSNFSQKIDESITELRKAKYAVVVENQGELPRPVNDAEFADLLRWIDSLDKI